MARGDKDKYSAKQKRQAEHIEKGYEKKGVSEGESEKRAWATVNKIYGGGAKGGTAKHKKSENKESYRKAGNKRGSQ